MAIQIQSGVFDIDECHFSLCTGIKMDKGKVFGLFYSFYWSIRGIFKDGFQFGFAAKKMEKVKSNYIYYYILLNKSGFGGKWDFFFFENGAINPFFYTDLSP